jgi:hypothetical protein
MFDWHEEETECWPVRYSAKLPVQPSGLRYRNSTPPRWTGVPKADTRELQKRLLWLLLAIELGMVLVAACVLPLVFLNLPVREKGIVGAILHKAGDLLGLSSQLTCSALSLLILLLTMTFNLWLFLWLGQSSESRKAPGKR